MPKEYIDSCHGEVVDGDGRRVTLRVRVGWSSEAEHVQIATIDPEGAVLSDVDGNEFSRTEHGHFVGLDRRGINDLIRHLRRARDQAFGRDE